MNLRAARLGACLCFLTHVVGGAQVQNLPSATAGHGGFGLPDQSGHRLLLMPNLAQPERVTAALCSGGLRVPLRFERRQVEGAGNNGRQTAANFDTLPGSVFTVLGDAVDSDVPCVLASDELLAGSTVLRSATPQGSGACLQRRRFATLRDRPVVHCWPVAQMAPGKQVALLEFERRGKDALASLVFIDGSRTIFADYPAEFHGAGQDLWRADDGGVLSPGLRVVGALQRRDGYALGVAWPGPEGQVLSLWISDGGDRFREVIRDYWYQAPI